MGHSHLWVGRREQRIYQVPGLRQLQVRVPKEILPCQLRAVAINKLESTAYYQKNQSVDSYLDEFLDLIAESGYTDLKMLVVKFQRGLDPQTQNAVATMANG